MCQQEEYAEDVGGIGAPGSGWRLNGYASVAGLLLLMMFYIVVAGWTLLYTMDSVAGTFARLSAVEVGAGSRRCELTRSP